MAADRGPAAVPLLAAAQGEAARFASALADPAAAQATLLARILHANAECAFGQDHRFAEIADAAAFRARVPVRGPDEFAPWIARVADGEDRVLTAAPAIAFEETGGTRSGGKLVPYTEAGLAGFRRAVLPWLGDLARRRPAAFAGRAYVTISPATRRPRRTPGGVPVGLASDAAYLGADLAPAFAAMLAVPPDLGGIADPAEWQLATLRALVAAPDLSFVSLWSPTFLLALLVALRPGAEDVLAGLAPPHRRRLERALAGPGVDTPMLWPALDCISCWRDGASAAYADALGAAFPHAAIDAKGLLATEAAVTVPWGAAGECVPAISSTFLEFQGVGGDLRLCHELAAGAAYRVIVTTESGLYRHDLGDMVECTGHRGGVPLLRFIGRAGTASDLVGEKLDDAFVQQALAGLAGPAVLAAVSNPPGYLLASAERLGPDETARVEAALCVNPQYAHARAIGQLAPLRWVHRPALAADIVQAGLAQGRRIGDVKPVALLPAGAGDWINP